MITLLSEFTHDGLPVRWQPLGTAPNYVTSRNATRWHRARSAKQFDDGRVAYSYWCGAGTPSGLGEDEVPKTDLLCATCDGRFRAQRSRRLVFTPRNSLPPKTCPASRRALFPSVGRNPFPCLVCGASVKVTCGWSRGPWVQVHQVGPSLIAPCPHHGWNRLTLDRSEQVVCGCTLRPKEGGYW